jgi:hypothetical protein
MLFTDEARTFGQLVSVAIGPTVGSSSWWNSKGNGVHYLVIGLMIALTVLVAFRNYIVEQLMKFLTCLNNSKILTWKI